MNQLMDAKDTQLFWEQPKASQRNFLLRSEKSVFAQLFFRSGFSTKAEATTGEEKWTFNRVGFFSTRVIIRQVDSDVDLATYQPRWTGTQGQVRLLTGEEFNWSVANFMNTRFTIRREGGNELINYVSSSRSRKFTNIFKQEARVVIDPEAWQIKQLPILVLIGWYLVILNKDDSAVVAATASFGALY
jgi:hypothetical protein